MARVRKEAYDNRVDAAHQKGGIPPGNFYLNTNVGVPLELITPSDGNTPLFVAPMPCPDDTDLTLPAASRLSADKRHQGEWIVHVTGASYIGGKGKSISFLVAKSSDREARKECPYVILFNALSALNPRPGAVPPALPSGMTTATLMYLQSVTKGSKKESAILSAPTDLYFMTGAVYRLGANQPQRGKKQAGGGKDKVYIPSCNGPAPLGMNPGDSLPIICLKGQVGLRLFDLLDKQKVKNAASMSGEFVYPNPTGKYIPGKGLTGGVCMRIWRPKEGLAENDPQLATMLSCSTWNGKLPEHGISQGYEVVLQSTVKVDPRSSQATKIEFTEEQILEFIRNRSRFAFSGYDDQTQAEIPGYLRFASAEEKAVMLAEALIDHPLVLQFGWQGTSFWNADVKAIIAKRKSTVGDPAAAEEEVPEGEEFPVGGEYADDLDAATGAADEVGEPAEEAPADDVPAEEVGQDADGNITFADDDATESEFAEDTLIEGADADITEEYAEEPDDQPAGEVADDEVPVDEDDGTVAADDLPEDVVDDEPIDDEIPDQEEAEAAEDLKSAAAAATQHIKAKTPVAPPPKPKAAPPVAPPAAKAPAAVSAKPAPAKPQAAAAKPAASTPVKPPVAKSTSAPAPAAKAPAAKAPAAAAKPPVAKAPPVKPPAAKPPGAKPPAKK